MNQLLTPKVFANTMLKLLKNNLVMGRLVTTEFNDKFKKVGDTVYVKRPPQFVIREGRVAQVQDVIVGEAPVTLDQQKGIDIEFTSVEETLTVDELLKDEIMNSKAATLAQEIDSDLMEGVLEFPDWVGTPGQTINSAADFFLGPERMDDKAVPGNSRSAVLATRDYWATASSFTTATYFDNDVNRTALQRAKLPLLGSVQPYMTQSVVNLVTGTRENGTLAGNGQEVTYASVADSYEQELDLASVGVSKTIKKGDVFTIGTDDGTGVYAVNPRTKATLDYLQQFVVLEDVTTEADETVTVRIANPIIVSGAYQTVDKAPTNGMTITWKGTANTAYRQNATFHKSAIALCFAKLVRPRTGEYAYATDPDTGISIRYWQTSDGVNDVHLHRWDVLYGVTTVDRRLGVRQSGVA